MTIHTMLAWSSAPTVLAFEELVLAAIGLLILFGGWIANRLKELHDERKRGQSEMRSGASESESRDLDAVAAQRREQLRRMARQRSGGGGAGGGGGGSAPAGAGAGGQQSGEDMSQLSMAERIARARAANQQRRPRESAEWTDPQRERERWVRERDLERRQREEAERQAVERERREQAERRRQAEARRRAQQQQQAQRQTAQRRQATTTGARAAAPRPHSDEKRRFERRQLAIGSEARQRAVAQMAGTGETARRIQAMLQGPTLRDAIILKEILDQPTSLRNPDEALWR